MCQDLLQQYLDGGAVADQAEVESHLRQCPACAALHAAGRRLGEGLRLLTAHRFSADLTERIVFRVRADYRTRLRRRWLTVAALAAGILAVVLARWYWPVSDPSGPMGPSPQVKGPPQPPSPPDGDARPDTDPLNQSVSEIGSAMASLTSRAAGNTLAQTKMLLPAVAVPLSNLPLEAPLEAPDVPLRDAGHGVSVGLEPVASSARRAVDLFLRELPPMQLDEKAQD
jgi:predicted anti-sigma-YlaC factor YlaD